MNFKRSGPRPSLMAPAEHFRVDPLFHAHEPSRTGGAYMTFEPCSRTGWDFHSVGQPLIVTLGCGLHQTSSMGRIEPGSVFDRSVDLDGVPGAYRAMNERESIKLLVTP